MMQTIFDKIYKRCTAFVLTFAMMLTLFSTYSYSASNDEEEYDRPWLWPVPGSFMVNSLDTYTDGSAHSQGQALDIGSNGYRGNERLDVVSATDGTVFYIQKSYNETDNRGSGWGNYVIVRSGNTYILYAHLKTVTAKYGEIKAGDVIGKMGNTGNSTGVHLHIQAYPVGEAATSTEIHIFDKYIDNPLYAEKFNFWAGLQKNSERYGETIRQYYKNVDGTYYTYSGGRELFYEEKTLSAIATTVNLNGTSVYSAPLFDADVKRTIPNNTDVQVFGYHIDAYGNYWYNISADSQSQWIADKDIGFKKYTFTANTNNMVAPNDTYGTFTDLTFGGTISSLNTIASVRAEIRKGDTVISECTISVNDNTYDIGKELYEGLKTDKIANGTYTYELFVTVSATFPGVDTRSSTYSLYESEFKINSLLADTIPPLAENISVEYLDHSRVKLGTKVTDDRKVESVLFTFESVGGSFKTSFNAERNGDYYYVDVPFQNLNGTGKYKVTAIARDSYGNEDSVTYVITTPVMPKGEVWVVIDADPSLRIRSGPGTSYSKLGSLYNGDKITVTEVVVANGYTWGKIDGGWCALEFCEYESGNMFEITFDLNGGENDGFVSSISKRYNVDIQLPSAVPVNNNLTFLGWSTDPSATKATYKAGATYSENASKVLYAIWGDAEKPVISGVSQSDTNWTNKGVTIIVNASDDSGTVYYSFDGGKSWRRENTFFVLENTEFPVGSILVKDPNGNQVQYGQKVTITNIDLDAPTPPSTKVTVTDGNTISFDDATDSISGISRYVLVYSHSISSETTEELVVTNGMTLNLSDGLYYAKLYIYDKADNLSIVNVDRFVVGDPIKLTTPSSFKIKATTISSVVFEWDTVTNSDLYKIYISDNENFTDSICLQSGSNTLTVSSLTSGIVYYAKIVASTTDNVLLDSDATTSLRFETISSDNTIHSLSAYPDAQIGANTVKIVVPFSDTRINMSIIAHERATVKAYRDSACTDQITDAEISFSASETELYVLITAENGDVRKYTLSFVRASQVAQTPVVSLGNIETETLIDKLFNASLTANVTDGGRLDIAWYLSSGITEPTVISREEIVTYTFDKDGVYTLYAVVTNTNEKCEQEIASFTTERITVTVKKLTSSLTVNAENKDYDGKGLDVSYSDYVGDGKITYKYYTDANCEFEVSEIINAGTYYVVAVASEGEKYYSVASTPVMVVISKAHRDGEPSYTLVRPTPLHANGYLKVNDEDVEYSINSGLWTNATPGESYTVSENDVIKIRYVGSDNYLPSETIEIVVYRYHGTDNFYPNGNIEFTLTDEYMLVNAHKITANDLISSLEKTDNVYVTDKNGVELNGYVYTSCVITLKDEKGVFKSLTIIILGDIDRDGIVTYDDALQILKISNGVDATEDKLSLVASDFDLDGNITSIDSYKAYQTSKQ